MKRLLLFLLPLAACSGTPSDREPPPGEVTLRLQQVASGLQSPVYLTAPPGDARLFIVEQPGRIRVVENGALLPAPFLDLAGRVSSGASGGC
jgi:glucose/arabinose dehydrogenase